MSWDYSVVVRGRKRKPEAILEIAGRLATSYEATLVDHDEDGEDDDYRTEDVDVHVAFARGGGTIEVTRLKRGYRLYLDSQRDGNRDSWDDIGGLANDLAAQLGTVIDDEELASEMIAESEPDDEAVVETNALADLAVVRAEARGGELLAELSVPVGVIVCAVDGAGMLRDAEHAGAGVLTEEGRYTAKVSRLVATLHDPRGNAYRRHSWSCDGYGRIISANAEDL